MDITCYNTLLYTTASLPMMLWPKAQALSYLVPTKYLFLPNSQAQSLEIPFVDLVIHGGERSLTNCYTVTIPHRQGAFKCILSEISHWVFEREIFLSYISD